MNYLCRYCRDALGKKSMEYWHDRQEEEIHGGEDAYDLWVYRGRR